MSYDTYADELSKRVDALESAIRKHRDSWLNGDDKCWKDNEELYKALPEGFTPPERDELVEIGLCQRYIASCHHPDIEYVSPQRRIEELEGQIAAIQAKLKTIVEVDGIDAGVIYLSNDGPTHWDEEVKCQVYDHEYFSPLGDALIELWGLTSTVPQTRSTEE